MTNPINAPSTAQLVAALAAGLLPLAGPEGIAVASLVPAVQQLFDTLTAHPSANYTIEDLERVVQGDNVAALAKLQADVDAMPDEGDASPKT